MAERTLALQISIEYSLDVDTTHLFLHTQPPPTWPSLCAHRPSSHMGWTTSSLALAPGPNSSQSLPSPAPHH